MNLSNGSSGMIGIGNNTYSVAAAAVNCIAVGLNAASAMQYGTNNIFIGTSAGSNMATGSCCGFVGQGNKAFTSSDHCEWVIGSEYNSTTQVITPITGAGANTMKLGSILNGTAGKVINI